MGHGHYRRTGLLFRAEARALVFRDDGNTKCGPDDNFCDWGDICCRSGRRSCNETRRKRESAAQPRATTELHCAESDRLLLRDPGGTALIQLEISEIGARVLIRHIHDAESQPGIDIFRNIFGIGVKIWNDPDSPPSSTACFSNVAATCRHLKPSSTIRLSTQAYPPATYT